MARARARARSSERIRISPSSSSIVTMSPVESPRERRIGAGNYDFASLDEPHALSFDHCFPKNTNSAESYHRHSWVIKTDVGETDLPSWAKQSATLASARHGLNWGEAQPHPDPEVTLPKSLTAFPTGCTAALRLAHRLPYRAVAQFLSEIAIKAAGATTAVDNRRVRPFPLASLGQSVDRIGALCCDGH